jgi:hypothetical protein
MEQPLHRACGWFTKPDIVDLNMSVMFFVYKIVRKMFNHDAAPA